MEDYLSEGGSCIAFGLGWVFNSYGDGKRGADLAGDYSGNRLLGAYGALWAGVYGGKEGRPAEPAEGHLAFEIREMLDLIEEGGFLGPEETKAMIGRFSQFGVTGRALHLMFSPAEQEVLLDFLGFPGRVTVPALESPLALAGCDGDTAYKMWGFFHEFGHNWQDRFDASVDTVSRVADLPVWTWEPEL